MTQEGSIRSVEVAEGETVVVQASETETKIISDRGGVEVHAGPVVLVPPGFEIGDWGLDKTPAIFTRIAEDHSRLLAVVKMTKMG